MNNQLISVDARTLEEAASVLWRHGYCDETTNKLLRLAVLWRTWQDPEIPDSTPSTHVVERSAA